MSGNLSGRVAIVTGGTRGIGAAISTGLLRSGATVVAAYAGNSEAAENFRAEVGSDQLSVARADVAKGEDCNALVEQTVAEHGRVDIVVNNAGVTKDGFAQKMSDDDWNRVLAVNLSGTFFMARAVLGDMLERGSGRIINTGSVVGQHGNVGQANYAASKAGVEGLTKSLAKEVSFALKRSEKLSDATGLTVNAVNPGVIGTEMVLAIPEKIRERLYNDIPLHRFGTPEEVAATVLFLCSDEAAYIHGQMISVNGGMRV